MQVRAAVTPNRALAVRPAGQPAQAPKQAAAPAGQAPAPKAPVKARNADPAFGSEIFQSALYALTNVGQIVTLPGGLSGLVQMLPKSSLGIFNVVMGGFNAFKDYKSLSAAGNTRNSDNYTRLAGDGAMIAGGALLLGGALLGPAVPLIGAGLAAAGYVARIVGIWNDESRW